MLRDEFIEFDKVDKPTLDEHQLEEINSTILEAMEFNNELVFTYYAFMQRFQRVLTYLTNYKLALFLEKFNDQGNTTNILIKVENVSKRSSLAPFYQVLAAIYDNCCFYCGKSIKAKNQVHLDHFIPWRFVQADQLWNLVISCVTCNLSKNDKLAKNVYLSALIDRNEQLRSSPKVLQRDDMQVYTNKKLKELFMYSIENGLTDFWVPKRVI